MSLYYHLLEEQIQLLKEKGYDEKSINSPDKDGWLFTQLSRRLSDAVRESWLEGEPITFEIPAIGFFNDNLDIILFEFGYEFNFEKSTLSMKKIELVCDKIHRKINITCPRDIPHSSEAVSILNYHNSQRNHIKRHISPSTINQKKCIK